MSDYDLPQYISAAPRPLSRQLEDGRWATWWSDCPTVTVGDTLADALRLMPRRIVHCPALTRQLPTGEWEAHHPGHGYVVTGATEEDAKYRLMYERRRRVSVDPEYAELVRHFEAFPPDGYEVFFLSPAETDDFLLNHQLNGAHICVSDWVTEEISVPERTSAPPERTSAPSTALWIGCLDSRGLLVIARAFDAAFKASHDSVEPLDLLSALCASTGSVSDAILAGGCSAKSLKELVARVSDAAPQEGDRLPLGQATLDVLNRATRFGLRKATCLDIARSIVEEPNYDVGHFIEAAGGSLLRIREILTTKAST